MKVLSLVPYKFLPAKMGGQKNIDIFARYLSKLVPLLIVSTKSDLPDANLPYQLIQLFEKKQVRYIGFWHFFSLKKIIMQNNITHVMIEHPYFGWLGILIKKTLHVKLVIHSQNIEYTRFATVGKWWWKILFYYERWAHRHAHHNFFITDADKKTAIEKFNLAEDKCTVITYGIEQCTATEVTERLTAKQRLVENYALAQNTIILLFNGTLHYAPNISALELILNNINPLLLKYSSFNYKIIICGNGLLSKFNNLKEYENKNIIYAGFVDDISLYYKAADVFLNPVNDGGGIKTKLVEALAYGCNAVSTSNGSIGVDVAICNGKLYIADTWGNFAAYILEAATNQNLILNNYFEYFFWGNIAKKAETVLKNIL
jgi:polysaccharide biosynthesis protein PslH